MAMARQQAQMSPRTSSPRDGDKGKRAQQLMELVTDFRSTACADGIRVDLLDADTQLVSQAVFSLDKSMQTVTLKAAFSKPRSFSCKDVEEVIKERELAKQIPKVAHMSSVCLGFRISTSLDEFTLFRFPDKQSRDDFYACIKVLFASTNNNQR